MIITENDVLLERVYNNIRSVISRERAGTHLSDLIYCLRKAYFRKKGMSPPLTDDQCLLFLTGYAFQNYMFPSNQEITLSIDGVYCTPDVLGGIEVKSTRQSMGRFDLPEMGHWQRQILGYCKTLDKLEYDLVVLFVCGDYKPPFPRIGCYHVQVTQEEVDMNWSLMLARATVLEMALTLGEPPEPSCELWEWEYCENVELCQDTPCYQKHRIRVERSRRSKK